MLPGHTVCPDDVSFTVNTIEDLPYAAYRPVPCRHSVLFRNKVALYGRITNSSLTYIIVRESHPYQYVGTKDDQDATHIRRIP